jgi:hypothetical protein
VNSIERLPYHYAGYRLACDLIQVRAPKVRHEWAASSAEKQSSSLKEASLTEPALDMAYVKA